MIKTMVTLLLIVYISCGTTTSQKTTENGGSKEPIGLKTITNSIGMEFVLIPSGSFMMGKNPHFEYGSPDETPQHKVKISKPFYLGKYEVTQEQWVSIMGTNPSEFKGRTNPVEQVSCYDVKAFINKLNEKEGTDKYRLPTEAEWEYSCRAGSTTTYYWGDEMDGSYCWYWENSGRKTHPVGQKQPNAWGLYDMHGNVSELCSDWYGKYYYSSRQSTDPLGVFGSSTTRVHRGGCWESSAHNCRSAKRNARGPGFKFSDRGFRLALSAE